MTKKNNDKLDELIKKSIRIDDKPTQDLNSKLRLKLYEQENMEKNKEKLKIKYYIYLCMTLNIIFCVLVGILASILIKSIYLYIIFIFLCFNCSLFGVIFTFAGLRIKESTEFLI